MTPRIRITFDGGKELVLNNDTTIGRDEIYSRIVKAIKQRVENIEVPMRNNTSAIIVASKIMLIEKEEQYERIDQEAKETNLELRRNTTNLHVLRRHRL